LAASGWFSTGRTNRIGTPLEAAGEASRRGAENAEEKLIDATSPMQNIKFGVEQRLSYSSFYIEHFAFCILHYCPSHSSVTSAPLREIIHRLGSSV
jgi:hypothetical protein